MEKSATVGRERKKPTSADALRLNIQEFGEEDMKHTKFNAYFNFATLFSPSFLKKLESVTIEVGEDVLPFNSLEILLKFIKHASMKGRPLLSSQIQIYTLHVFKKYYLENGKVMSTKVYETVLLNYLFMVLTIHEADST